MKILAAVLLTATLNTSALSWRGTDGYVFEQKEYDKSSMVIRKVEYQSLTDLRRAAALAGKEHPERLNGFSLPYPKLNMCVIHVMNPLVMNLPETFGHEAEHCFYGDHHPSVTALLPDHSKQP